MEEKIQVLYVDDEPDILLLGKRFLEKTGIYTVKTSNSATKAIKLLKDHSFDVIVSDYKMPGMDGIAFEKYLKSIDDKTLFILFTVREREEVIIEALNTGVDFFLHKGTDTEKIFDELSCAIKNLVSQRLEELKRLEEQKRIANIIEYLPDPMFAINNDGIVIAWNRAMVEMTGIEQSGMIGLCDHAYSVPFYGDRRKLLIDLEGLSDDELASHNPPVQKKGYTLSSEVFTPALYNGRGAYVWAVVTPLFDEKGNRVGTVESIRDITERKNAEYELLAKNNDLQAAYEEISASEEELCSNLDELIKKDKQLQESRERYLALYVHMVEGAALHDIIFNERGVPEDYRIVDVNPSFEKILGLNREQVIGKTSREAYGVSIPPYLDIYAGVAISGEPLTFEVFFLPLQKHFSISVYSPYKGSFATIFTDITEQKRSNEALQKSEKRLKEAQQLALIGNWEFDYSNNHLEWSDVIYKIFERNPSGFKPSYEAFLSIVHPDDREEVDHVYALSLETRKPYCIEHRLLMDDGRVKYVFEQCETFFDPIGKAVFSLGTIQDVTARKKIENSLKETNEYLENLINIANVPIIVWDSSFHITRLNHAFEELIGRSGKEIIGSSVELLFPPDKADRSMQLLKSTLTGVRWDTTEISLLHNNGSIRTIQWNSATLFSSDGKTPVATIAQGHDITRERQLEQERDIALSQIKHNLACLAILNDGIRNPLNIILAFSDLLGDQRLIEEISLQIERIDMMVSQLDKRWIESEKILDYLRKHHHLSFEEEEGIKNHRTGEIAVLIQESEKTPKPETEYFVEDTQSLLYTLLDSIDSCIYVADPDTYDLIFMNQCGRAIFGNITGKKCYDYLNSGGDGPCSFCSNHILNEQRKINESFVSHHDEYKNPWNGRWYKSHSRLIRWIDGRIVKIGVAHDITTGKEMETELLIEKSLIRFIEKVFPLGVWRYSFETRKFTWSEGMYALFGLEKNNRHFDEDAHISSFIHPEDRDLVKKAIDEISQDKIPRTLDYRIIKADGSVCLIHSESRREYDESGKVTGITGFSTDNTRETLDKSALHDTVLKLETIMSGYHLGSWESNILTGNCEISEGWAKILGYSIDELAPVSMNEWLSFIHPDDKKTAVDTFHDHISGKNPFLVCQVRMKHKDGSWRWIEVRGRVISWTKEGDPFILFGTHKDISRQKLEDIRLRESEMRYKYISDSTSDFVFSCTRKEECPYEIDWVAGAVLSITGYSLEEILSLGCWRVIVHPDDLPLFDEAIINLIPGASKKTTLRLVRKDGEIRWIDVHCTHVSLESSDLHHRIYGGCRDVTDYKIAEEELEIVQEKYTKAFLSNPEIITISNLKSGLFIEVNDASTRHYGYSRQEMIGKSPLDLNLWQSREYMENFLKNLLSQGKVTWYKAVHCRKSGELFDVAISADTIMLQGETCIISTVRDISILKKTESSLRESEERYHNLVQNLPGYVLVHQNGIILFVNQSGATAMGYTPDEIIGTYLFDYVPPESQQQISEAICHRMNEYSLIPFEITVKTRHGRLCTVEVRSVKIEYEGSAAILSVFSDISERKQIEEALRKSETKYRQFVEYANDAIIVAQNGYLTLVNPRMAEMAGYSVDELLSVPFSNFIHPDDREKVVEMHMKRLKGEHPPSRYQFRMLKKNGEIMWVEISAVLFEWEGAPATLNFLVDVTERIQAEEAIRESNRKLRLLTGLTRHDVFNQLSTIDLFQTMALESLDIGKIHEYVTHARAAGKRIENIISFTREYEDFGIVASGWKHPYDIIESALSEVTPGSILVENHVPGSLEIYVDPIIRKVFTTILENAVRHGKTLSKIKFYCETSEEFLIIVCEDDGIGIPPEEKDMIFEHGFGTHTGIGLFLAKEILSITGLSIREQGIFGKGARFEIIVPAGKFRSCNLI
ncbi:PAS domain S-box protein [Methanospirillum stamsii]|uniref:histidine kinase n=1 Tax=Methanospirillum stamsii TaxID=1277351 RepID=A0A2V2NIT5_9EURY|nr:PAS domain S-box protein [Methanospirillum stamsii]PWR76347.1 hypothetical protein DLD82_00630 [Methanospirillum stamsii]